MVKQTIVLIFITIMANQMILFGQNIFCRFKVNDEIKYGVIQEDIVHEIKDEPWYNSDKTGKTYNLNSVELLSPSDPKVIIGLAKSYKQGWKDKNPPSTVRWFLKPHTSAAPAGSDLVLPASLDEIKVEVELVLVIGKTVKNADEKEAANTIFGYTLGNDITGTVDSYHRLNNEPLNQEENILATGLKIADGFQPFGPYLYENLEWNNREMYLKIYDEKNYLVTDYRDNTSNLLYSPAKIVSDLSRVLTLSPGDIVTTGTGKSFIAKPGYTITMSIDGIGEFTQKIIR